MAGWSVTLVELIKSVYVQMFCMLDMVYYVNHIYNKCIFICAHKNLD